MAQALLLPASGPFWLVMPQPVVLRLDTHFSITIWGQDSLWSMSPNLNNCGTCWSPRPASLGLDLLLHLTRKNLDKCTIYQGRRPIPGFDTGSSRAVALPLPVGLQFVWLDHEAANDKRAVPGS